MESIITAGIIILAFLFVWRIAFRLGKKKGRQEKIDIEVSFIGKDGITTILDGIKNKHDSDLFTSNREN